MKLLKKLSLIIIMSAITIPSLSVHASADTLTIQDAHGQVQVPHNPQGVVALDNRTFETLSDWGIPLLAAPKDVMPSDSSYIKDEAVLNIGNHREPNLEIIAQVNPELVIVGQRFASYYEDIKAIVPQATVIDLSFDVSETAEDTGTNLKDGLIHSTQLLGEIFDKTNEADALITAFDQSIADAKAAYNGSDTVMAVIVSGGTIGFSGPQNGRVWGPLYSLLNWVPALEVEGSQSDHKGDEISIEAIAQSNPDWIVVLDRDAAIASQEGSQPASEIIEGTEVLKETTAIAKKHVIYAPIDTYTNESIQTFTEIFNQLAQSFQAE